MSDVEGNGLVSDMGREIGILILEICGDGRLWECGLL